MPARLITHLLLDTSYLTGVGAPYGSDFEKLVALSKRKTVRIMVPHVAWEERRTQLVEEALEAVQRARGAFHGVARKHSRASILSGLTAPVQVLWKDEEIYEKSKEAMKTIADDAKLEIVPIGPDHAQRAWERYFSNGDPFNPAQKRDERRKDIPDSWILEAAIDLRRTHPSLRGVCGDKRLADALEGIGVPVFRVTNERQAAQVTQDILDAVEVELKPPVAEELPKAAEPRAEYGTGAEATRLRLAAALGAFGNVEEKVFGFVGYLGEVSKEQLTDLLARTGVRPEMARNAAERLALSGVLVDTGNHYLPADKEAGARAAALVEVEIVELLKGSR